MIFVGIFTYDYRLVCFSFCERSSAGRLLFIHTDNVNEGFNKFVISRFFFLILHMLDIYFLIKSERGEIIIFLSYCLLI